MTLPRPRFITAFTIPAIAFSILLAGCSESDEVASESSAGGGNADAAGTAMAPALGGPDGGMGNQATNEFGAAGGEEDYGNGDYGGGSSHGGGGGMAPMAGGPMSGSLGGGGAGHGGGGGMAPMAGGPMAGGMGGGDAGHGGGGMSPMGLASGASGGGSGEHGNSNGMMPGMGGGRNSYGEGEYEEGQYAGSGMQPGGMGSGGLGMNRGGGSGSSLPADPRQWSDDDFVTAAREKNVALLTAIQTKSQQSTGDPAFADLMGRVLNESAGVPSGPPAGFGFGGLPGTGAPGTGDPGKGIATPYKPKTKVPPGGAFLFPAPEQRFHSDVANGAWAVTSNTTPASTGLGIDSIELMIAESLLGYIPQAAPATLGRAGELPGAGNNGMTMQPPGIQGQGQGQSSSGGMTLQPPGPPGMGGAGSGGMTLQPPGIQGGRGQQGSSGPGQAPGLGGPGIGSGRSGGTPGMGGGNFGQNGSQGGGGLSSGRLEPEALVEAVVAGLVKSNTPASWTMLREISDGQQAAPVPASEAQGYVLMAVLQASEFDDDIVKSMLESAYSSAMSSPQESQRTLQVLALAAAQTTDHYFKFSGASSPVLPPNRGSGAGRGLAGPGGAGMGMNPGQGMGAGMGMNPGQGMGAGMGMNPGQGMGAGMGMNPGQGMGPGEGEGEYGEGNYGDGNYGGGMNRPGNRAPRRPPTQQINISETMYPILASVLWNKSHASALASAIAAAGNLQAAEPLMPLAVSIPNDLVRKAVFEVLESEYKSGAGGLMSVGFFDGMLRDPGMLPTLKSLPRQRPPRQASGANVGAAPEATPESTWTDGTRQAVLSLRDRLRAAAGNPELAYEGAMPVRLHRDAIPQRSIRFTTSNDELKALGDNAPSKTTYYYASCSIAPTKRGELEDILDHYERRAKAFKRLNATQTMLWFDGVKTTTDSSRVSMDVIIEEMGGRSGGGYDGGGPPSGGPPSGGPPGGGGGAGSGQYQIEVIIVEARDPSAILNDESDPSL